MKGITFGVCTKIENAQLVHAAGFDFIECTIISLRPEESDYAVRDTLARFRESPVRPQAFNVLLPGDLNIVGDDVDGDRLRRYLSNALERVKEVGGETVVFGSGKARMVPQRFAREKAEEQLAAFLDLIADFADPLEITIAIEPLNTTECNIINSVPEAARLAGQVNRKSIGVLADFYHMYKENEPLEHIVEHKELLRHVHVSDDRYAPGMGSYPYDSLADCIRRAGYNGRISIECLWNDFGAEAAAGLSFLKRWRDGDGA
ncbi:sugar phosphate isomerase/epimerase family protein [Paenibacillus oceani]|uniref:Sugar phosphate isomerase/epimerase n=1 Tax=Paenibacillus oceani TaxID=2772510 RepID=A0A927H0C1_9BACL|nr:sugar phosphate isomerase/epimerase family protein [Paenibacillus oceani]MBD2863540.1 sugar phosphate isomerase/epimerase [Paenibacillus oceani]